MTALNNQHQQTTERTLAAYNSTFAIGGVSYSADSFVVAGSSVLRINFCGKKPAHRKAAFQDQNQVFS
jgi:hypothetical protein